MKKMDLNTNLYGLVSFILFMQWRLCNGGYAPCPLAELGETITLRGTFTNSFEEEPNIIWMKKTGQLYTYSKCNPDIGCRDSMKEKTETSLTPKGNNVYEFSFRIKSITDDDFDVWYLKYSGSVALVFSEPLYSCNLTRLTNREQVPLNTNRRILFIRVGLVLLSSIFIVAVVLVLFIITKKARNSKTKTLGRNQIS
jgi:hypothetical protein